MVEERGQDEEEKHRRALEHRTSWTELSISNQLLIGHAESRHERYVHHVCNCGCWIHCENVFVLFLFPECSLHTWQRFSLAKLTTNLSCRHPKPARQNIVHQNMMILTIFWEKESWLLSTTIWCMVTHCLNVTRPSDSSIPPFLTFTNTTEENMSGKKLLKGKQYRVLYLFDFCYTIK